MSDHVLGDICDNLGDLTSQETFQLFQRLWDELTEEQQEIFRERIEDEE